MIRKELIGTAIVAALNAAARDPKNGFQAADAPAVAAKIEAVAGPTIAHMTNAEPWYRSRVTWGAIISVVAGLAGVAGYALDAEDQRILADGAVALSGAAVGLVSIVGGLVTWWGRWRARTTIGNR